MSNDTEIKLTPTATILAMTASLPPTRNGSVPYEYEQEIESVATEESEQAGQPDPAHNG